MRASIFGLLLLSALVFWGCPKDEDEKEPEPTANITVTSPNGGESWQVNQTRAITWTSTGVTNVTIQVSSNSGTDWTDIAPNIANNNSYNWTVANQIFATNRVRVFDPAHTSVSDQSDADFTITAASGGDAASGAVTSDQEQTIETTGGARIRVPLGAVPRQANGAAGTVVFSIESDASFTPAPPTGETQATPVYRFGPEGMVFNQRVEITIPLSPGVDPQNMNIYRMNPTTNQPERYASTYDASRNALVTYAYSMSLWFGTSQPPIPEAWGCVHVENVSVNTWLTFCVDSFSLEFPALDLQWMPEFAMGGIWAPVGHIGITSESNFRMPQGTYWVCRQFSPDGQPNVFTHDRDSFVVADPWNETQDPNLCLQYPVSPPSPGDTGRCNCTPTPTLPVGTGAVQVTLTWYNNSALDLDLWVTEPDSERCWYANPLTDDGGSLDRDNLCGNYINGQPENIFWLTNPPVGEYVVEVDWYSDCGNGLTSQEIQLRTVVQGTTRTFAATIQNGATIEVTRFNVTAAGPQFLPPLHGPRFVSDKPLKSAN